MLATGIKQRSTPDKILLDLLEAELAERKAKSIRYQMGLAKFPVNKDLDRFDFNSSPVDEMQIRTLCWKDAFWPSTAMSSWWVAPAPARPTWLLPWAARQSETAGRGDSSIWLTWSTDWNRRNLPTGAASWQRV